MSVVRSVIAGTGSCLPDRLVTNKDMESFVDTSDEWIVQRTGIEQRYLAAEGQKHRTSPLARRAWRFKMRALRPRILIR